MIGHAGLGAMATRPPGTGGWIGYWSPGIGDPTVVGWVTVGLYATAAGLCWWIARKKASEMAVTELFIWRSLAVGLGLLGINKQLDLQTALTELARMLARDAGWYGERHRVQRLFIFAIGLAAIAVGGYLLAATRRMPAATTATTLGACALLAFVVIRASSFHHVDLFIRSSWSGVRGNWLVEVGGLLVILAGAFWRWRTRAPARAAVLPDPRISGERRPHRARRRLEAPLRRPGLVGGAMAAGLAAALAAGLLLPPRYRARAVVRGVWGSDSRVAAEGETGDALQRRHLEEIRRRAFDRAALEHVVGSLRSGLDVATMLPPSVDPIDAILSSLQVERQGSDSFLIECVAGDPAMAALVSNEVAKQLAGNAEGRGHEGPATDDAALEARLVQARNDVQEKEAALLRWQDPARVPPLEGSPGRREALEAEREAVVADLAAARDRAEQLRQVVAAESQPPAPDERLAAELGALRARREELRTRYTEAHPDVEALTRQIGELEAAIARAPSPPRGPLRALEQQLADVEASIELLSQNDERLSAELARLPALSRGVSTGSPPGAPRDREALARDLEQAKASYASFEEQWQTAEAARRIDSGTLVRVEVLQAAVAPSRPYSPDRLFLVLVGLALGLAIGVVAAVIAG